MVFPGSGTSGTLFSFSSSKSFRSRPRTLLLCLQFRQDIVSHYAQELISFHRSPPEYWRHGQKLHRFSCILLHSEMSYTLPYIVFTRFPSMATDSACSTIYPAELEGPLAKSVNLLSFLGCVHKETPKSKHVYCISKLSIITSQELCAKKEFNCRRDHRTATKPNSERVCFKQKL